MVAEPQDSQKLYRKIALAIAAAIADGRYGPGEKLPSEREFADSFGVSRPTIRDAMIALEFQGLVEARQGSGVYVNASAPIPEDAAELENLRTFTRELLDDVERDLGTKLDWVAVDHWNTDNPHVHVLIRGRTDDGQDLVISRAYISRGFRDRAAERVTMELGRCRLSVTRD